MPEKISKKIYLGIAIIISISFLTALTAVAVPNVQNIRDVTGTAGKAANIQVDQYSTGQISAMDIMATVLSSTITGVGVVFLVYFFYGAALWMTARGNEEKVEKSIEIIKSAFIGIIIVLISYLLTYYIFKNLTGSFGFQFTQTPPKNP